MKTNVTGKCGKNNKLVLITFIFTLICNSCVQPDIKINVPIKNNTGKEIAEVIKRIDAYKQNLRTKDVYYRWGIIFVPDGICVFNMIKVENEKEILVWKNGDEKARRIKFDCF